MKNKYSFYFLTIFTLLLSASLITSCDSTNEEEEVVAVKQGFQIPQLLEREKDLSYDEFLKIKEKFNKLSFEAENDQTKIESLIKLSEIYIYEARVTGEHPYYYNAALVTLNETLKDTAKMTTDQHFTALFYKSTVQLSQHKFNEALATGKKALALNNTNSGIYGVLVDANVEIGNYDEAVKNCDKMISIRPDLRSYSRISYLREIYGDMKGSIKSMEQAIEAGAPYSEYKCWTIVTMGKMLENHNQLDSAMAYYQFSAKERANYPFGIAGMASVEGKLGNYAKADSLYTVALNAVPEISFIMDQAKLYKKQGKKAEMKRLIPRIESMFQEDIESGHNVNMEFAFFLLDFKKDFKRALDLGLKEYQLRPNNIDVNRLLAFAYFANGDKANAAKHVKIAMKTNKQEGDLYCISGLINNDKKQIKKAFSIDPYQDHLFAERAKKMI
ncbi:MAG: tetratricopeptide repeat protein [Fluviicola sp.]